MALPLHARARTMAKDIPSSTTAFNKLPIELNQIIANYLDADRDIASYSQICRATRDSVQGDGFSYWRVKFRKQYAYKKATSNKTLKKKYQSRRQVLREGTGVSFHHGHSEGEQKVIAVLKDLINESFQGPLEHNEDGYPHCPNLKHISKFVLNSKLFFRPKNVPKSVLKRKGEAAVSGVKSELQAIKLLCSHFLFDSETALPVWGVEETQQAVYAPTNEAPIFKGAEKDEVNMEWLLYCMNFFRNYMTNEEMGTMCSTIQDLPVGDKPSVWRGPLKEGCSPLDKHWKGTFAFLKDSEELERFRGQTRKWQDVVFMDHYVDEGKIQTLKLDFVESDKLPWPKIFEERLQSLRPSLGPSQPQRTRAQKSRAKPKLANIEYKSIQLTGNGIDEDDEFFASGWLNPLPPQYGIPGWQRVSFMKHFLDDYDQVNEDDLWAYEGVVLPGGRIILGRWWGATAEPDFNADNCGPFILWACDGDPELHEEEDDDPNKNEPPIKKHKFNEVNADEAPTKIARAAK